MDFGGFRGETERMFLRPYSTDDFAEFSELHGREDVAQFLPWPTRDAAASQAALERHQSMTLDKDNDGISLGAFDPQTKRLVGEFVLFLRSVEHRGGEIGYVLHPDFQGLGLATEGGRAMLQLAFETMHMHRVVARIDARNVASAGVLHRLGMRHEAHLVENEMFKGEWSDEDQFAILHREWSGVDHPLRWSLDPG